MQPQGSVLALAHAASFQYLSHGNLAGRRYAGLLVPVINLASPDACDYLEASAGSSLNSAFDRTRTSRTPYAKGWGRARKRAITKSRRRCANRPYPWRCLLCSWHILGPMYMSCPTLFPCTISLIWPVAHPARPSHSLFSPLCSRH